VPFSFSIEQLGLTDRQREAVITTEGPLLVFAGAGSGKTRVITSRIAYLLGAKGVPPEEILAVTFTNKAAREMRERAGNLIGDPAVARRVTICTFHALGLMILKREHRAIGYPPHFVVYTPYEQVELLKKIMDEERISREQFSPHTLIEIISFLKNDPFPREAPFFPFMGDIRWSIARRLLDPYERALRAAGAMDFDDLIQKTISLFEQHDDIRRTYAERWRYLMVDEYQDTNRAQYHFLKLLSSVHGNICAVGDDDQSIYSWRGARMENILEFADDFPGTRIVKLEENFRSVKEIVATAGRLIAFNRKRAPKNVFAKRSAEGYEPVTLRYAIDEQDEAQQVANDIATLVSHGKRYSAFAVIVRTNAQTLPFEKAFSRSRIPYRVIGGQKFFENKEIKDLLAYLRILVNQNDEISLRRIINYPPRGIGAAAVEALFTIAATERSSPLEIAGRAADYTLFSPAQQAALASFSALYRSLSEALTAKEPVPFAEHLVKQTGIESAVVKHSENNEAARIRLENIHEFVNAVAYHRDEHTGTTPREFWIDFINAASLLQPADEDEKKGVCIITAHSAKGLEFDVVFVPCCYQGGLPNRMALEEGNIEEERRLCYVAFTRARERLIVSAPRMVTIRGRTEVVAPSLFLAEAGLSSSAVSTDEKHRMALDMVARIQEKIRKRKEES